MPACCRRIASSAEIGGAGGSVRGAEARGIQRKKALQTLYCVQKHRAEDAKCQHAAGVLRPALRSEALAGACAVLKPAGFSGRKPCRRCTAYRNTALKTLNASMLPAYCVQRCSTSSLTPQSL